MTLQRSSSRDSRTRRPSLVRLALSGASAFWIVNFLISLTPLAAHYRSALSIDYVPMLVEAAVGGLLLATAVSWCLLTFPGRIPGHTPMVQSLLVSLGAFVAVTVLIEVPSKALGSLADPWPLLGISIGINALRILALGVVIGRSLQRTPTSGEQPRSP